MTRKEIRDALERAAEQDGLGAVDLAGDAWEQGRRLRRRRHTAVGGGLTVLAAAAAVGVAATNGWLLPQDQLAPATPTTVSSPSPSSTPSATQSSDTASQTDGSTAAPPDIVTATTAAQECSAQGQSGDLPPQDFPGLVSDTALHLLLAAQSCDAETLVLAAQRDLTTLDYLDEVDPAQALAVPDESGRYLALSRLLSQTRGVEQMQEDGRTLFIWPAVTTDQATDQDWQDLVTSGLYTQEEVATWREQGYDGWQLFIREDGTWANFTDPIDAP